jgi:hypothetical protein
VSDTIGGSTQLRIREGMVLGFDSEPVGIPGYLLLKAAWDRLFYLCLLELSEGASRMEAGVPDSLLLPRKNCSRPGAYTHCTSCKREVRKVVLSQGCALATVALQPGA